MVRRPTLSVLSEVPWDASVSLPPRAVVSRECLREPALPTALLQHSRRDLASPCGAVRRARSLGKCGTR